MHKAGWNTTSLEPDGDARARAKDLYGLESKPAAELYSLSHGSYDAITLWHVLEHVHRLHEYLDTFYDLLRPGGVLIIAVPNYTSQDAKTYAENWAAYDVPRHLYHFSPKSMQKLLNLHHFKLLDKKPMWFDSFYVSLLSEKYISGKSNFVKAFSNGLLSNMKAIGKPANCSSIIYIGQK